MELWTTKLRGRQAATRLALELEIWDEDDKMNFTTLMPPPATPPPSSFASSSRNAVWAAKRLKMCAMPSYQGRTC